MGEKRGNVLKKVVKKLQISLLQEGIKRLFSVGGIPKNIPHFSMA